MLMNHLPASTYKQHKVFFFIIIIIIFFIQFSITLEKIF